VIGQSQCLLEPEPADLKVAVLHEDEVRGAWFEVARSGLAWPRLHQPPAGRPSRGLATAGMNGAEIAI